LGFDVQSEVIAFLSERGYDQNFGARPLKRAIQEYIENPLSKAVLSGEFVAGDTIHVGLSQSEVSFTKK
jgi:ATP-dependent Clp protease ATP-binding subunit ClpB